MEITKEQKQKNLIFDVILLSVIVLVLFFVRQSFFDVIRPFIYALIVSYFLNPIIKLLDKLKFPRILSILLIFALIIGTMVGLFAIFIPEIVSDITAIIELLKNELPSIIDNFEEILSDFREGNLPFLNNFFGDLIDVDREIERVGQFFGDVLNYVLNNIYKFLVASSGTILNIVMTPIIAFYYLKDKDKIMNTFMKSISSKYHIRIRYFAKDINKVIGGFIRGQFLIAIFVGSLTGLGCWIIGVPYPLTVGVVAGITNIIPYFGPWIGGILPVILALMDKPISAIWVIILIVVVQQIESSLISPQVMSHSVGIHPLLVIFSVVFFGKMMGIIGMIIAVPLTASIILIAKYILEYRKRKRSQIILP